MSVTRIMGNVPLDVRLGIPAGTAPMDLIFELIEGEGVILTSPRYIINKDLVGMEITFESVFTVRVEGTHTVMVKAKVSNPWGEVEKISDPITFELIGSIIPIILDEPWKLWFDTRAPNAEGEVAKQDFIARGWNVVDKEAAGEKSAAKDDFAEWTSESYHTILIFSDNQCVFDTAGRGYMWGSFIAGTGPGTFVWGAENTISIRGNEGRLYNSEDHALVKYFAYKGRSHILIYDTDDHYPMASDWHRTIWTWVANRRASVKKPWFIFNKDGRVVDHG